MKNSLIYTVSILTVFFASPFLGAQGPPTQWKFHFAFEDATGARDTIWIGLDENGAVGNLEPELGEVPVPLDSSVFNVWMNVYPSMEAFKVMVSSLDHSPSFYIYGMNAVLPVILSWDTALFHAPVLQDTEAGPICNPRMDNQWFFFQTNAPWLHHQYSMILTRRWCYLSFGGVIKIIFQFLLPSDVDTIAT